jgi:hypothetical protein
LADGAYFAPALLAVDGTGGRFGGVANVEEFTEWRWFSVQEQRTGLPY